MRREIRKRSGSFPRVMKYAAGVLIAWALVWGFAPALAQDMDLYIVGDAEYTGKIDAVIAGKGFYDLTLEDCETILIENCIIDTLTMTRCTAVSIKNSTIKNLVMDWCVSVEGKYITFSGSGTAMTLTDCVGVRITQSEFSGDYDDRLEETDSAAIDIDTKSRPATRRKR